MALKRCPHCGEKYSDTYKNCPFCEEEEALRGGRKIRRSGKRTGGKRQINLLTPTLIVLILIMGALLLYLLFGDRFPFRYLADDYGLAYYAAFSGCSAETEASFETVIFLANKLDELGLHTIMTLEGSDGKLAQTIANTAKTADVTILSLDSMQSTTKKDVQEGAKYLAIMEKNLHVLEQALR